MNSLDDSPGPIFTFLAPFLKMYTAYSNKYEEAINTLNTMVKKNEKFAALLRDQQAQSGTSLSLSDLLIMPIQRVPRYSLLLKDLIASTPEVLLFIFHSLFDYNGMDDISLGVDSHGSAQLSQCAEHH